MISVIVPVYNVERYIRECIDSILSQTFTDWELILVDDGSTDSCPSVLDAYASTDRRIRVIHKENGGLSSARNSGLECARGEFIVFVDGDDALYPEALKQLMDVHSETDADLVEGSFTYGKSVPKIKRGDYTVKIYTPRDAIEDVLYQKILLPSAWGKLYRKKLFGNIRFREGILYEDLDVFYLLFAECNKIAFVSAPVYFYRMASGSILHVWNRRRADVLDVTERIEKHIAENNPSLLPAARDRRLSANFNIFSLASIHGEKGIAERCWKTICAYRGKSLFDPNVRLKNKAGIMLSYLGKNVFKSVAKAVYR